MTARLQSAIDTVGDAVLATAKPRRSCASWVDGSDVLLTLHPRHRERIVLDSCLVDVRDRAPAIRALDAARREIEKDLNRRGIGT